MSEPCPICLGPKLTSEDECQSCREEMSDQASPREESEIKTILETLKTNWPIAEIKLRGYVSDLKAERDQLAKDVRELEAELINKDAIRLWNECETLREQVKVLCDALERYAHIPIANDERNASSAPSNQNFIAREALEKLKCM